MTLCSNQSIKIAFIKVSGRHILVFFFKISIFPYLIDCTASCGSVPGLVTWPGIEFRPTALRAWRLNCWISRKFLDGHISLFIFLSPALLVFSTGDCVFLTMYLLASLRPYKALSSASEDTLLQSSIRLYLSSNYRYFLDLVQCCFSFLSPVS